MGNAYLTVDPALKRQITRNTLLLSASMAALTGMIQLGSAVATLTFVSVTGLSVLSGLGPAIIVAAGALTALPAGRAMDRLGRAPVLSAGFATGMIARSSLGLEPCGFREAWW